MKGGTSKNDLRTPIEPDFESLELTKRRVKLAHLDSAQRIQVAFNFFLSVNSSEKNKQRKQNKMTGRAYCIDSASMKEAMGSLDSQWTLPFKNLRDASNFNLDFRRDEF